MNENGGPSALPATPANRLEDSEMLDTDNAVEEYDFSNEAEGPVEEDDGRDTEWHKNPTGVITILDDDDNDDHEVFWQPDHRPWREAGFTAKEREIWENMYCLLTNFPMGPNGGDWETTEEYMRQKDQEMLRYMEDHPITNWVIPPEKAQDAYNRLVERSRWRNLGIRIYGSRSAPSWMPGTTPPYHSSNMRTMHMQRPSVNNNRPFGSAGPEGRLPQHGSSSMPRAMTQHHANPRAIPHGLPPPGVQGVPPPPVNVLRSQPNAQPVQTHPNGLPIQQSMAEGAPASIANEPTPYSDRIYTPRGQPKEIEMPKNKGKAREKKSVSLPVEIQAPLPPPPTPPYEKRQKPADRKPLNKSGRRNMRRQAEAEIFPWNRELDFKVAKAAASWDDSIYDQSTLDAMAEQRKKNEAVIERIDSEESEKQRRTRNAKKQQAADAEAGSGGEKPKPRGRKKVDKSKDGEATGDQYHSGSFCFATTDDEDRAKALGKETPDEIMEAYDAGEVSLNACARINISWNPGKRGITADLVQGRFSIKDTLATRQQLDQAPILTRRAAECIVDFCPDMLWREMLLRIASEAGFGNKDIRDRMCHNGNYCDKATITKRIGAALGQKQQQSTSRKGAKKKPAAEPSEEELEKIKGYAKGEDDYYYENVKDFAHYVEFFGKRTSHRGQFKIQAQAAGRKRKLAQLDGSDDGSEDVKVGSSKRSKTDEETAHSPEVVIGRSEATDAEHDSESGSEEESEDDPDAVSIQSDTMLDEMDDD